MTFTIMVVDDEKNIRQGLGSALEMDGYNIVLAENGQDAQEKLKHELIDLIITDLKMPKLSGEELLKYISSSFPTIPVIVLTGHGTVENAVNAMRDGAYDFLTKPVNLDHLGLLVKRALSNRELIRQHEMLKEEVEKIEKRRQFNKMIGKSSQMQAIFELINQVAPTKASVLITGESGVGKELVAEAIHRQSNRTEGSLIKTHCAALSESLLESELFGHEKGAFTGAVGRKKGRFELAHKGTIFLDEIGEINQSVQIKLLRVLQEKQFERVGGEDTLDVDVRIVAATNRDLIKEVEKGNFREDLYYRLNIVNIHIPPLRERKEDIPLLYSTFLVEMAEENGKVIHGLDVKARMALNNYSWPGNIRELRNCIESAVVMSKGPVITVDDLPPHIRNNEEGQMIKLTIGSTMAEAEKEVIRNTLIHYKGNKSKTAEILGIGRKTLHRKLHEYNLEEEFSKHA
ncbi:sigma-54-dependent transcriptional regulator [Spirochaeta cellobiosiphila]|uniref:sigma-54-dependent transcriptional regulator n=1 Tax=Spirochaeta cellobiosiphila TaxID=504483 RepID=UPI000400EAF3|nr:sigma-54 dependent transcriptional regulator [Spirochaeta cellobiosiphila]